MKSMNLPDRQELIWFVVGIWVAFFVVRMIKARDRGLVNVLMYFFIAVAPPGVIIFQGQFMSLLQDLRAYTPE